MKLAELNDRIDPTSKVATAFLSRRKTPKMVFAPGSTKKHGQQQYFFLELIELNYR